MITGANSADAQSYSGEAETTENDWLGPPVEEPLLLQESDQLESSSGATALGWFLVVAALSWVGFSIWSSMQRPLPPLMEMAPLAAMLCVPLILLGLVWLIFGRSSRRETQRFRKAVAEMQRETAALESILGIVANRLEENYSRLTGEAAKLMSLGDEASDRIGRVTHYISKETAALDRRAEQLESAANAARVDIGVLLTDLPRAEEQARAVAESMKQAGLMALGEAGQLEIQLSALIARGREADEVVGGTAQRLAAHLTRIESSTAAAREQLDGATSAMTGAVDDAMSRTSEAVDAARGSLEAQGQGMLAMIEHSRAALEQAGGEAARGLAERLHHISQQVDSFAAQLAAQDVASQTLTGRLASELDELDQRFVTLGHTGQAQNEQLAQSVDAVRQRIHALHEEANGGQARAAELMARAQEMVHAFSDVSEQLRSHLPAALSEVEQQADRTRTAAEQLAPVIEAVQVAACDAATQAAAAEASIGRQRDVLGELLSGIRQSVAGAEEQLQALTEAALKADAAAGRMASHTGPELVEALLRVREAATQAAERARETIAAVIPQTAAQMAEASQLAIRAAVSSSVESQVQELSELSARAAETARAASERLTRQMLALGSAAQTVDAQIRAGLHEREEAGKSALSQRVSLLIESLNSTAIDVAKILSNDVTDAEWSAYLKGDRGVFTRRAVRLLNHAESREISRFYETDAEFREQVGRYIHDFEAILRRVTNENDGNSLAVTILSSDMGKLYVALAQATERLRL